MWRARSEVLALKWPNVDFRAKVMRLERGTTKNGEPRELPFDVVPALKTMFEA